MIQLSTEIHERRQFADLCNKAGIRNAVEVGVDHGWFAEEFLKRFDGEMIWLVDDYEPYPEMPWKRDGDMMVAVNRLMPYVGKFRFIRCNSLMAAKTLPPAVPWISFGFVYIDAAHNYESVRRDLIAWWDVVAEGGILAGHDYDPTHPDVIRAVDEFAEHHGLTVFLTHEAECASWYCVKR